MSAVVHSSVIALVALCTDRPPLRLHRQHCHRVTFEEAIRTALEKNPTVAEAAQAILRAEALAAAGANRLSPDAGRQRGHDGPRQRARLRRSDRAAAGADASWPRRCPIPCLPRRAGRRGRRPRIRCASRASSVTEVRRQIAVATAQAYLAVIAQQRQVEVNLLARENAQAHVDYARARLAGRRGQQVERAARVAGACRPTRCCSKRRVWGCGGRRKALGVLMAVDAPVDAAGEPVFEVPAAPAADAWLTERADVQLFSAQVEAADRVVRDSWKDWVPTRDGGLRAAAAGAVGPLPAGAHVARLRRRADSRSSTAGHAARPGASARWRLGTARIQLTDVQLRARAELRTAQAAVESTERARRARPADRAARRGRAAHHRHRVPRRRHHQHRAHRCAAPRA